MDLLRTIYKRVNSSVRLGYLYSSTKRSKLISKNTDPTVLDHPSKNSRLRSPGSIYSSQLKTWGFTLVELLIVVIILAVLAAIVTPQFSESSNDTKLAALQSNLMNLRTAIDLYTAQHGHFPGATPSAGTCASGTNIENATPGAAAFVAHLTMYTSATGVACTQRDGPGGLIKYGPYLRKSSLPNNPVTEDNTVEAIQTGSLNISGAGTDSDGGWRYDFIVGKIIADQPSYEDM